METVEQVDAGRAALEAEVASLCGVINASHARLVAIVAGALADESWAGGGVRSPEHWLTLRAGLSPFRAREVVSVARRCGELPSVMAEFAAGQLSLDQVIVIARYAPAHVEASVAELAVHASVPQLRRALSRYSFDPPAENGHHQQHTTRDAQAGGTSPTDTDPADTDPADTKPADTKPADTKPADTKPADTKPRGTEPLDAEPLDNDSADSDSADAAPADADSTGSAATDRAAQATAPGGVTGEVAGDSTSGKTAGEVAGDRSPDGVAGDPPPTWNGLALDGDRGSAPAELSMSHDQWGRFTLRFSAPADVGALVEAALKEAQDALFHAGQPQVTLGEAFVEVARRSLGSITSINRRDSYRTYVHLDTDGAWLTGQPRLPTHLSDKLTCDGILQPVWHTQGAPVNVGRAQRIVPTRTRRLIEDRDRGCRFPGCATTRHLECHHLVHWADGGPTDTFNLACLCPFHHDTHHDGDFTVKGDANNPAGLTFTTRNGFPIHPGPTFTAPAAPVPAPPVPASPAPANPGSAPGSSPPPPGRASAPRSGPMPMPTTAYRGATGETLNLRWVTFHEPREPAGGTLHPVGFRESARPEPDWSEGPEPVWTAWV